MGERSRWERLDGDSGRAESPRIAELVLNRVEIITAARGMEKAARRFQYLVGGGPAELRQIGGDNARLCCTPGMKRLGHGAEILTQAGRFPAGDSQRKESVVEVEAMQLGDCCGSPECAARSRAVKTLVIMARRDRLGDLALHFRPDVIGKQQVPSG